MPVIIVERTFETPPADADLKAIGEKQAQCLDIHGVTYKQSALSDDHRRMICQYEAADMESVRKVQRETGAPFDRIWTGKIVT
jgi:Nickel responsive protein SCO4226-like